MGTCKTGKRVEVVVVVHWQQAYIVGLCRKLARKRNLNGLWQQEVAQHLPRSVKNMLQRYRCLLWMHPSFSHGKPFLSLLSLSISTHTLQRVFGSIINYCTNKIKSFNFFIILHFLQNKKQKRFVFLFCRFYLPVVIEFL